MIRGVKQCSFTVYIGCKYNSLVTSYKQKYIYSFTSTTITIYIYINYDYNSIDYTRMKKFEFILRDIKSASNLWIWLTHIGNKWMLL